MNSSDLSSIIGLGIIITVAGTCFVLYNYFEFKYLTEIAKTKQSKPKREWESTSITKTTKKPKND